MSRKNLSKRRKRISKHRKSIVRRSNKYKNTKIRNYKRKNKVSKRKNKVSKRIVNKFTGGADCWDTQQFKFVMDKFHIYNNEQIEESGNGANVERIIGRTIYFKCSGLEESLMIELDNDTTIRKTNKELIQRIFESIKTFFDENKSKIVEMNRFLESTPETNYRYYLKVENDSGIENMVEIKKRDDDYYIDIDIDIYYINGIVINLSPIYHEAVPEPAPQTYRLNGD